MKSKIIQLCCASVVMGEVAGSQLYALCADGSVWKNVTHRDDIGACNWALVSPPHELTFPPSQL